MTRDLISKATRNDFREALVGLVLRDIDMIFDSAGLQPKVDFTPAVSGQRRARVEQYYANVNFSRAEDVAKLVIAFDEALERFRRLPNLGRLVSPEELVERLCRRLEQDGFKVVNGRFTALKIKSPVMTPASLIALSEESISEHIDKAREKIATGDFPGAISNAYTLVEGFLKQLLRQLDVPFKPDEGDIRALYKIAVVPLNLSPGGESLESHLKTILQGLTGQIGGLFEVANKASDRHARRYNPARHHAKLAVNAAFTLCEFMLDSFNYQRAKAEKTKSQEQA